MTRPLIVVFAWCSLSASAAAQVLPSDPLTFADGRAVLSGDISASLGSEDEGFFNYSDYEHSTLRALRIGVAGLFRLSERISVLGEIRSENFDGVVPVAMYARIRPVPGRRLDIQVGRIPPSVGPLARRTYGKDNPLIGSPLAYQYLTSLRADALPADLDELLTMRGRGWLSNFTIGDPAPARGVPLVSSLTFDTGVQVTAGWRVFDVTGAITTGTLSNPRVADDNAGKQFAGRISATPATGLIVGSSLARGAFASRQALAASGFDGDHRSTQTVQGIDVEYSRGYWVARADVVFSAWRIPFATARRFETLRARAVAVEGRYTVMPGLYAAARAEHLSFNRVGADPQAPRWEAPVSRLEVGGGYYVQRNVVARASIQLNRRDAGRTTRARLVAGQLLFWF